MTKWKKILLGFMAAIIITLASCVALLDHMFSDMCATTVINKVASPNGNLMAVLFQVDCGATTGFNSHVAIVPGDKDLTKKDSLSKSFFAADCDNGRAPAGNGGGPEVRLHWLSDNHLALEHHESVRLIRADTSSSRVAINYRIFR